MRRRLRRFMYELGYETTTAEMRQRLKSILSDAGFRTFVAEMDGQVCGMIGTLAHASHEHNDPSGKIIALVVSKKQRHRPRAHRHCGERFRESKGYASESNNQIYP